MFKDYEDRIVRRKEEERRMKEEVEELSEKVLKLVEVRGFEPLTSAMRTQRSPS